MARAKVKEKRNNKGKKTFRKNLSNSPISIPQLLSLHTLKLSFSR